MTLRLSVCIFILLMATLISLQNPLPVLNLDNAHISSSNLEILQYNEKDGRNFHVRRRRQAVDNIDEEIENHNQCTEKGTGNKHNEVKDRKKRLETEEESIERNQFYKSVSDETKQEINPDSSKRFKEIKSDPKLRGNMIGLVKLNAIEPKRHERQAPGVWGENNQLPNNEWVFRGGNKAGAEEFNENTNKERSLQTLKISSVDRKGRECLDVPEMAEVQKFSPDTLETMRKINPLTIGDQVSQMIHERNCNTKNKLMSKSSFGSEPGTLQNEAQVADLSSGVSHDIDYVASRQQAACDKQQPSKGVQKPCPSNDYGFSVIILAGDPLKMGGSGTRSDTEGKVEKNFKKTAKVCEGDYNENQSRKISKNNSNNLNRIAEHFPNKEHYVPNKFDANVNFPVYDKDLTFIPDPFNGLLEEEHSGDPVNKQGNRLFEGDVVKKPTHKIFVRGIQKKNGKNNGDKNVVGNGNGVNNGGKNGTRANNGVTNRNIVNNGVKYGNSGDNCVTIRISGNNSDKNENYVFNVAKNGNNRNRVGDKGNNNAKTGNANNDGTKIGNISSNGYDNGMGTNNETAENRTVAPDTTPSSLVSATSDSEDATPQEIGTKNDTTMSDEDNTETMNLTLSPTDVQDSNEPPSEIKPFGDLVINQNVSCQSWGIYYNNTVNDGNKRNISNSYNNNNSNNKTKLLAL